MSELTPKKWPSTAVPHAACDPSYLVLLRRRSLWAIACCCNKLHLQEKKKQKKNPSGWWFVFLSFHLKWDRLKMFEDVFQVQRLCCITQSPGVDVGPAGKALWVALCLNCCHINKLALPQNPHFVTYWSSRKNVGSETSQVPVVSANTPLGETDFDTGALSIQWMSIYSFLSNLSFLLLIVFFCSVEFPQLLKLHQCDLKIVTEKKQCLFLFRLPDDLLLLHNQTFFFLCEKNPARWQNVEQSHFREEMNILIVHFFLQPSHCAISIYCRLIH